ncbi:MAG TPA: TIGR00266 family protein [Polyangiaceae bacterium]|nr:TIGR00266 family protein [Polyangiaceae bacterium]
MKYDILDSPDFAMLQLVLDSGEKVVAESGAMVAKDTQISIETSMRGGLLGAAKRKLLGGESLFQNTFTSAAGGQRLYLSTAAEGDMKARTLAAGESFFLQSGAYVAHSGEKLVIDTKFGGVKGFFSGVGFFMLRIQGPGTVFYGSYGALHEVEVGPEGYTVDTGHIVGFTEGLTYNVRKFGGFKGLFFSGEGLICDFHGQGKVYVQTRNASSLAGFLHPFRRVKAKTN